MSSHPPTRDAGDRTPARCFWRALIAALPLMALVHAPGAEAGSIVVGRSGPTNGCTVPSIQAAINRANGFGGHNVILVTDDVADGVHHENLNLRNLRSDLRLEIIGGFNNCRDLTPTASGKASIYGGGTSAPVVNIQGDVELVMRGLWLEGGTYGIGWAGTGDVEISEVTVNNNRWSGVSIEGNGGLARFNVTSGVQVTNNETHGYDVGPAYGVSSSNRSILKIRGVGNRISGNDNGINVMPGGQIDVGASGNVISSNRENGVYFYNWRGHRELFSYIFSTDPNDPLRVAANAHNGIFAQSDASLLNVCIRNIALSGNKVSALVARGPYSRVQMNGSACEFPPEADIACDGITYASCNTFYDNGNGLAQLIRADYGGRIAIDRALFYRNKNTSLLSTNLATDPSAASITLTRSVAVENTIRDNLFEALNGGIVDVWDSTIAANLGGFGVSLVSINPGLLQLTNTILDQPQTLMAHTGNNANVQLNRVLAPNQSGAEGVSRTMLIGRPTFINDVGRLSPFSLGVDYAPAGGGIDRDGNPRDVDTLDVPNVFGPRDLGAYEVQQTTTDRIMKAGFESGEAP